MSTEDGYVRRTLTSVGRSDQECAEKAELVDKLVAGEPLPPRAEEKVSKDGVKYLKRSSFYNKQGSDG